MPLLSKRPSLNFFVEKWVKNTNNQIDKGIAEASSVIERGASADLIYQAWANERTEKKGVWPQAPQAENRWCMRQLVYIENCMGKSPNVKKLCK